MSNSQREIDELNEMSLGHSSSPEENLADLSTDALRRELARRVEHAKTHKETRAKELRDLIQKSSVELERLTGQKLHVSVKEPQNKQVQTKNQKAFEKLPGIVKVSMPKELRESMENGEDVEEFRQRKEEEKPVKKSNQPEAKRCDNCGATASNWEYSQHDDSMYCVCGNLCVEGVGSKGFNR